MRFAASLVVALAAWIAATSAQPEKPGPAPTDLDALMERVLARRDDNWRT